MRGLGGSRGWDVDNGTHAVRQQLQVQLQCGPVQQKAVWHSSFSAPGPQASDAVMRWYLYYPAAAGIDPDHRNEVWHMGTLDYVCKRAVASVRAEGCLQSSKASTRHWPTVLGTAGSIVARPARMMGVR